MKPAVSQALEAMGIEATKADNNLTLDMRLSSALSFVDGYAAFPWGSPTARDRAKKVITASTGNNGFNLDSFCGGTGKDLADSLRGDLDLAPFQKAYAEFKRSGLGVELQTVMQDCQPRRRRRFSEDQGEWQYERRHEDLAFCEFYRKQTPSRVIDIDASFSISGNADPKDIDRYGALVWGVSQLIENCGIQTRITWRDPGSKFDTDRKLNTEVRIALKQPGEYLSPSLLAATFKANFFRRLGFALIVLNADIYGKTASNGLGDAVHEEAVRFSEGKLSLSPQAVHGYDQDLKKAIFQAIKG